MPETEKPNEQGTQIRDKFRQSLKEKGWKQKTLAKKVGISEVRLSRIMSGSKPRSEEVDKIARAFGIEPETYIAGTDYAEEYLRQVQVPIEELHKVNQQLEEAIQDRDKLDSEIKGLTQQVKKHKQTIEAQSKRIAKLEANAQNLRLELDEHKSTLQNKDDDINRLRESLVQIRTKNQNLIDQVREVERKRLRLIKKHEETKSNAKSAAVATGFFSALGGLALGTILDNYDPKKRRR